MTSEMTPPVAKKVPSERTHHGDTFVDPYEWMRDKDNPDVIAHIEAENAYTQARTAHLDGLRDDIFNEIKTRTKESDMSVPVRRGNFWMLTRTFEGKDYPVMSRVPALPLDHPDAWVPPRVDDEPGENEEVILDLNAEADGHEFFSLGSFSLDEAGKLLVWSADYTGDERYTVKVRDVHTGEDLDDTIENTFAGAFIDPTGNYIFYTTVDEAWRPDTVWRYQIGAETEPQKIFHERDERFFVGAGFTRSHEYLMIVAGSKLTSSAWMIPVSNLQAQPRPVWDREDGVSYAVDHAVIAGKDRFVIVHDRNTPDSEAIVVPVDLNASDTQSVLAASEPLIPPTDGMRVEHVEAFEDFLAVTYRSGGFARVGVMELAEVAEAAADTGQGPIPGVGPLKEVKADEPIGTMETGANPEFAQPTLRLSYESFITPPTLFQLDTRTGEKTVLKQQEVLGGIDFSQYRQALVWATAEDGEKIPVSLAWNALKVPTGWAPGTDGVGTASAPMVIYGYGSYEISADPNFFVSRLSVMERGVVWAVAHVRGGGEMGRHWYDNGKMLAKKNTFSDFIAATKHLHATGVSAPETTVALGGSAGGLLMGVIANEAPEQYAGICALVPFVDPLTSILMPELPLTVIEWEEWGDPLHDPEVYAYMKSYAPYENVGEHPYPKILAITSLNDTRVLYVEPAKWVARLREVGADVIMKTEMVAGHGGASGRYSTWKDRAFEYAWVLDTLGLAGAEDVK